MGTETPRNEPEEIKNIEETENVTEMSPEDLQEMVDQIPALKEMLRERETKLSIFLGLSELDGYLDTSIKETEALRVEIKKLQRELQELGEDLNASSQRVEILRVEIQELRQEISEREELLGE